MRVEGWERRVGLSMTGSLSLFAVVAVLVLVSLPRLHGFALDENERDAVQTVRLLAERLPSGRPGATRPRIADLLEDELVRQLSDTEALDEGRLLRRHGYLFGLAEAPPGLGSPPGHTVQAAEPEARELVLVAWPWEAGRTGKAVVLGTPAGALFLHSNPEERWDGERRPRELAPQGWRSVP